MITLHNVSFSYEENKPIFYQTNLTLSPSKTTVVLGKNGSGKTTLFQLISDILTPDFGEIQKQQDVLFIPDTPMLYEYLTGYEYLDYIKILSRDTLSETIHHYIKQFDLSEHMGKLIHEMSLGMKHKLALLSGVLLNYQVYLIDEPLTALDPPAQKDMIALFKYLANEGKTLILSTHMMSIAYEIADELVVLTGQKPLIIQNTFKTYQAFETAILPHFEST